MTSSGGVGGPAEPSKSTERRLLGAVLAGGESRRFGRDKASEPLGATSMLARAVATLEPHCVEVVIVSSRTGGGVGERMVIPDLRDASGPLVGIEAALSHAVAEGFAGVFVLACDLPLVDASLVATILDAWGEAPCAAPARQGTPDFEPLCAVYSSSCLVPVRLLLDADERAAWRLLERVGGVRVPMDSARLLNVNTQADLAAAKSRVTELEARGSGRS